MREGSSARRTHGSAGDADYGVLGRNYTVYRRPEPSIARLVAAALGDARTVVNVGAGAGSYEPVDRDVTAVEPSAAMRAQRPASAPPALDAVAERLPFDDASFDAAMTTFSVHQWPDLAAGLSEMRRVSRGPVVVLTCDPARVRDFWLDRYAPDVLATEARRYPAPARIVEVLGGRSEIRDVPVPLDCRDGFNEAYYGRPERLLEPAARQACSAWSFVAAAVVTAAVEHLRRDLASGAWDRTFGALRTQPLYEGSLILIVSRP